MRPKTCVLGQVGNVAVHLSIHFDVLHHGLAIGFQATIEVVQVLYPTYFPSRGIEQFW